MNQSHSSASGNPIVGISHLVVGCSIVCRVSTVFLAMIQSCVQLGSTAQVCYTNNSVAHASELIWDRSCQILFVCVHCRTAFFADTTDHPFKAHIDSDLLLLLTRMGRLRIWFDHGRRNCICILLRILFYRLGLLLLLLLLLLLSCKNMNCECLHLEMSICVILHLLLKNPLTCWK